MAGAKAYYLKAFVIFRWFILPDRIHWGGGRGLFLSHIVTVRDLTGGLGVIFDL